MKYKYDDKSRSEKSNDEMNELRMHNLQLTYQEKIIVGIMV